MFANIDDYRRLSAAAVLLVLLTWETVWPFFIFHGTLKTRVLHGMHNCLLGLLNVAVVAVGFVALWALAADWSSTHGVGLLHQFAMAPVVEAIIAILLLDLWTYWWHRANHELPFLWRFHHVHHSDVEMDVTSATRFHVGEIVLSSVLRVLIIVLIGAELWQLALYEALLFPIVQLHHANISFGQQGDRLFRALIVTPGMHKVHHSHRREEANSNYTSLLSVWDRVFRTYSCPQVLSTLRFGVDGVLSRTLGEMLRAPFGPRDGAPKQES